MKLKAGGSSEGKELQDSKEDDMRGYRGSVEDEQVR